MMPNDPLSDAALLDQYLAGELDDARRAELEARLAHGPLAKDGLAWIATSPRRQAGMPPVSGEDAVRALMHRLEAEAPSSPANGPESRATPPVWMRRPRAIAGIGAALVVMLLAVFVGNHLREPAQPSSHRYATAAGQIAQISLANGTIMTLAPAAEAQVTDGLVTLQGEAYFSVAPNTSRPFRVRTLNAEVRVLGTRFTVRQYPGDSSSSVVVEDGKVSLYPLSDGQAAVLTAGMRGQVGDSMVTVTTGIAVHEFTGWMQRRLSFDDETVGHVVAELARAYGVEIHVKDSSLIDQRITLETSVATEPIAQVLEFISRVTDAHVVRVKDAFVIAPGRAVAPIRKSSPLHPSPEKVYGI